MKNKTLSEEVINELYHSIDGKYEKDESSFYHYTNVENFHGIVNSLVNGKGLSGSFFHANLSKTYGGKVTNEFCFVRSDRTPDNHPTLKLSPEAGDIKFSFKEDRLKNKFGKARPIQEYPIQYRLFVLKSLDNVYKETVENGKLGMPPVFKKKCEYIKKNLRKMSIQEFEEIANFLGKWCPDKRKIKDLIHDFKLLKNDTSNEHMEVRHRVPEGKFITLDLINKIYLPSYLKGNKEINADIIKLRGKGFNNIVFYNCKYPKDPDKDKYLS